MLYKRIKKLAKARGITQPALGENLGLHGRTFQAYLTEQRQDNLWPYLQKILEKYPEISRDWLYFGEGEMLRDPAQSQKPESTMIADFAEEQSRMQKELADTRTLVAAHAKTITALEEALALYRERYTEVRGETKGTHAIAPSAPAQGHVNTLKAQPSE